MELYEDNAHTVVTPLGKLSPATHPLAYRSASRFDPIATALTRLPDETLMGLVARGDSEAFSLLYKRHARAAAALATQMCKRRVVAEDVVQEAFLSFWRSRHRFDPARGSVRAWVLGIVRNRAIDFLRHNVAHEVADTGDRAVNELLEARDRTDGEVGRRERAREVLAALDGLPPEQSCVITLAYYGGYTHTEIATMLETPVGTVKGRMRLGLRKMAGAIPEPC
jgi:RNA polymerase sigma-70 factor, ECF subfamily